MSQFPKVSIITVCYNAEATLEKTIETIIGQTYPEIEYVVIDGGSKDNTLSILDRYRQHIQVLLSEKDKGLYDAMNKGLRHATGDFVWFMNAGDLIPSPETLAQAMQGYNGEDFIYGKTLRFTEAGEFKPWHKAHPKAPVTWRSFRRGMVICHQSMLMRRHIAAQYDLSLPIVGDLDWTIRSLKQAQQSRDCGIVLSHFLEGGISTKKRKASWRERFGILRQHFGLLPTVYQHFVFALGAAFQR